MSNFLPFFADDDNKQGVRLELSVTAVLTTTLRAPTRSEAKNK